MQACDGLTYPGGSGDAGTFIWADSQEQDFISTGSNQFLFFVNDTTGSLWIVLSALATGNNRISVAGDAGGAATLSNGGAWTNASSSSCKTGFVHRRAGHLPQRLRIGRPASLHSDTTGCASHREAGVALRREHTRPARECGSRRI